MKRVVGSILFSLALAVAATDKRALPPNLEKVEHLGCSITARQSSRFERGGWYVTVWADYHGQPPPEASKHHWEALYSVRERRFDALTDCDRWMESVGRARRSERK